MSSSCTQNQFLVQVSQVGEAEWPDRIGPLVDKDKLCDHSISELQYATPTHKLHIRSCSDLVVASESAFIVLSSALSGGKSELRRIFSVIQAGENPATVARLLHSNVAGVYGTVSGDKLQIIWARDRRGYSSIYWARASTDSSGLIIGTHPEDLAAATHARASQETLARYVQLKYFTTHGGEESFWEGIFLVPPASVLTYSDGRLSQRQYWVFPRHNWLESEMPSPGRVQEVVENAVLESLANSREVVLALSGGMDSTVVATILARNGVPFRTITANYANGGALDEVELAGLVARRLEVEWDAVQVSAADFLSRWAEAYRDYPTPLSASTEIGFDLLMGHASLLGAKTFVIAGSSDQLFAGNHPEFLYNLADVRSDDTFQHEFAQWVQLYNTNEFPKSLGVFADFLFQHVDTSVHGQIRLTDQLLASHYLTPKFVHLIRSRPFYYNAGTYLRSFMALTYWQSYVQPARLGLRHQAQIHSLQIVDPFVSDGLFDWAWRLPPQALISDGIGKRILRRAFEQELPPEVSNRKVKVGFDVPFGKWIAEEVSYRDFISQTLACGHESSISDYVDFVRLRRDFLARKHLPPMLVWQACNAVLWEQHEVPRH